MLWRFGRGQKINANFFCTMFFKNPSGHGRSRQKSWTSAPKSAFVCGPVMGRNILTQSRPGVRVRNVRGKSGPKSLCLCCFFFPDLGNVTGGSEPGLHRQAQSRGLHKQINSRKNTVRAEIITELILKRAGPIIFKTFLLESIAFRPIPVICPPRGVKPENYWKR